MTIIAPPVETGQADRPTSPIWAVDATTWEVDGDVSYRTVSRVFGGDASPVVLEAAQRRAADGTVTTSPAEVCLPGGAMLQLEEIADIAAALLEAAAAALAG